MVQLRYYGLLLFLFLQVKQYECATCGKKYQHKKNLQTHFASQHDGHKKECPTCGKKVLPNNLARHMDTHKEGNGKHRCLVCGATFKGKSSLTRHVKIHKN